MLRIACAPLLLLALASLSVGCDAGGLLTVEHKGPQQTLGPSVNEIVNGGTFASNSRYRLFYTNGQGTPNQGVSRSEKNRLNGGLSGAAQ